jgi:microsomal dipeptidase-like Zn-dependent dipeptidase
MSHEPSSSAPAEAHRRAALTHVPDIARPAADLHATARIVDLHIHPGMTVALFRRDLTRMYWAKRGTSAISVRANFQSLRAGNVRVSLSVAHVPEKGLCDDFRIPRVLRALNVGIGRRLLHLPSYAVVQALIQQIEATAAASTATEQAAVARSVAELDALLAAPEHPLALIHAVEGAHALGDPAEAVSEATLIARLERLHSAGVAYMTLAHFYPNHVVSPCYPFPEGFARLARNPDLWRDLSDGVRKPHGMAVIERMMDLGMLIDLSHSTPAARKEIIALAKRHPKRPPLLMTHVGAYAINPTPYNPSDWEIRQIADTGGVIGVIFMNYWTMPVERGQGIDAISRTLEHLTTVGGVGCAGFGSDFDGFTDPPDDLTSPAQLPRLTQRLIVDGYREDEILAILGGNALRALRQGWLPPQTPRPILAPEDINP